MSGVDGLVRGLRDGALLCVAFLLPLCLVLLSLPAKAQAVPPGDGFSSCVVTLQVIGPNGEEQANCVVSGEPGVQMELWGLSAFMCSDSPVWEQQGWFAVGQGVDGGIPRYCLDANFFSVPGSNGLNGRGQMAVRRTVAPPDPAASGASAAVASSGDIDRVVRAVQALLAALVLAAGVSGYRTGLS